MYLNLNYVFINGIYMVIQIQVFTFIAFKKSIYKTYSVDQILALLAFSSFC